MYNFLNIFVRYSPGLYIYYNDHNYIKYVL